MREIGKTLLFFGVGSMVLFFLNMEFIILTWVDMWGEGIGWGIRFAMVIAGIACFVMGGAAEEEFEEA